MYMPSGIFNCTLRGLKIFSRDADDMTKSGIQVRLLPTLLYGGKHILSGGTFEFLSGGSIEGENEELQSVKKGLGTFHTRKKTMNTPHTSYHIDVGE